MTTRAPDMAGLLFGALIVVARTSSTRLGAARWACQCACGATVAVEASNLRTGRTKSCGKCPAAAPPKIRVELYLGKFANFECGFSVSHWTVDGEPHAYTLPVNNRVKLSGAVCVTLARTMNELAKLGHILQRPTPTTTYRKWMKLAGVEAKTIMRSSSDEPIRMAYDQLLTHASIRGTIELSSQGVPAR